MDSRDHSISPPAKRARVAIEAAMTSAFKSMNGSNKKRKLIDSRMQPVGGNSKKPPMHSGRWTMEEEQYVEGMIAEFKAGLLPISEGTTMRSFLAKMLNCNPKRVSKKYDGNPIYNGKLAYVRSTAPPPQAVACQRQENLLELERKFREALLTMQRVESRLKTITGQMALQEKEKNAKSKKSVQQTTQEDNEPSISSDAALIAKVASVASSSHGKSGVPPISEYCPSSSAVSSLTNEEEDADRAMTMATSGRAEDLSIAQVSGGGSSRGNLKGKPVRVDRNSLVESSSEEQAATLSLMNASSPAGAPKPLEGTSDDEKEATLTLLQLNSAKTDEEVTPAGESQPAFHTAAVSVAPTSQSSGSSCNQNNHVDLQSLLQKLEGFRQHPGQQGLGPMNQAQLSNSVANAPVRSPDVGLTTNISGANLQEFLTREVPRRRFDSPIQQPVKTRNSLQELLHALQETQQAPELPNQIPANAQQQQGQADLQGLLQMAQQQQPPVLQNPVKEAKALLQALIQASNQPPQAVPSYQQQALAGGLDNISAGDLQNLLQQISNATNSATTPRPPPQPPVQQQQQAPPQDIDMANMLQGFLQTQQVSQPACSNNQRVINSPVSQQGGLQQQQQPRDGFMSILMGQLAQCVSNQPQQQQPQQGLSMNNQDFQQLLQSVAPSMNQMQQPQQQQRQPQQNFMQQGPSQPSIVPQVHAQQQVNPPIEQNCQVQVPDPESLQRFLIQLQQQSQGSK